MTPPKTARNARTVRVLIFSESDVEILRHSSDDIANDLADSLLRDRECGYNVPEFGWTRVLVTDSIPVE